MLEDMRKLVRAGIESLSNDDPDDLAGALKSKAQGVAEQLSAVASGFLQWSSEARDSLMLEVKHLVGRQVDEMGLATKKEVQALRNRVDELERRAGGRKRAGRSAAGPKKVRTAATSSKTAKSRVKSRVKSAKSGAASRRSPSRRGRAASTS
jgi:polyhydroxyalkanoate synthesis regulator phasin